MWIAVCLPASALWWTGVLSGMNPASCPVPAGINSRRMIFGHRAYVFRLSADVLQRHFHWAISFFSLTHWHFDRIHTYNVGICAVIHNWKRPPWNLQNMNSVFHDCMSQMMNLGSWTFWGNESDMTLNLVFPWRPCGHGYMTNSK